MRQLNMTEIKELQMQILDFIHNYCEKEQLVYSISSGTLLGAVRHGGFIPWDDDIDISMPRADYERLRNLMLNDQNKQYKFVDWTNESSFIHSYGKVIDTCTNVEEKDSLLESNGLWVDIFPVDYIPESLVRRYILDFLRKLLLHVVSVRRTNKVQGIMQLMYFCVPLTAGMAKFAYKKILMSTHKSRFMMNLTDGGPRRITRFYPSKCFSSVVDIKFENRVYKAMIGYEEYLKKAYGDYMQLPPEDQRVSHNIIAYAK